MTTAPFTASEIEAGRRLLTGDWEFTAAAGVRRGIASSAGIGRHWSGSAAADALDAKADAFAVLAAAGAPMQALQIAGNGESKNFPA